MKRLVAPGLLTFLLLAACGPYGAYERTPGLFLGGSEAEPSADWSQVQLEMITQIETRSWFPLVHNIWAASSDGKLYVRGGKGGRWTNRGLKNPEVRLRSGDSYYLLYLTEVTDAEEIARVNEAFNVRYGEMAAATAHYDRHVFQLSARP